MSNEQNITNRRFNFNKNSKHIVSNSQNFLDKPINMNVQNINNNEINIIIKIIKENYQK